MPSDVGRFIDAAAASTRNGSLRATAGTLKMIKLVSKKRRLIRKLEQAMLRMAPCDRVIFLGHFVDDATFFELARQHGVSVAEVEAALRRGLVILADVLEPEPQRWWRFWRR